MANRIIFIIACVFCINTSHAQLSKKAFENAVDYVNCRITEYYLKKNPEVYERFKARFANYSLNNPLTFTILTNGFYSTKTEICEPINQIKLKYSNNNNIQYSTIIVKKAFSVEKIVELSGKYADCKILKNSLEKELKLYFDTFINIENDEKKISPDTSVEAIINQDFTIEKYSNSTDLKWIVILFASIFLVLFSGLFYLFKTRYKILEKPNTSLPVSHILALHSENSTHNINQKSDSINNRKTTQSTSKMQDNNLPVKINPTKPSRIPNAQVNKPYKINLEKIECSFVEVKGLENIGLEFNYTTFELSGLPILSGEFSIVLKTEKFGCELLITISPDPKSLWKNIPSDSNDIYSKRDEFSALLESDKHIVAASKRGRSHAHTGAFRDDHFTVELFDGWYILAVADGAGSAKYSRKGSEIACKTVVSAIKSKISENNSVEKIDAFKLLINNSLIDAYSAIELEAKKQKAEIKDFATTLLLCICRKVETGYLIITYWVGDGAIAIYKKNKEVKVMGKPDSGDFAGQTRFFTMREMLTTEEIEQRICYEIVEEFSAIILMTDGISDAKFETEKEMYNLEKWDELWTELDENCTFLYENKNLDKQLLNWLDFWSRGNHDDRTIAILY